MNNKSDKKRGISILGVLLLGIILLLVLSYFDISIRSIVEGPSGKDNFSYAGGVGRNLWNEYFKEPLEYFWKEIWLEIFWHPFVDNMERLRDGKPTDLEMMIPEVGP